MGLKSAHVVYLSLSVYKVPMRLPSERRHGAYTRQRGRRVSAMVRLFMTICIALILVLLTASKAL